MNLFVERARGVSPRFSVAEADDAAAVVEICRRVDGIPLAIELAASRMASMTASEVRDRLDHRFRLLVGSRRAWNATKRCATRCSGPTTSSLMPKRNCWKAVRCSQVGSNSKAPALLQDWRDEYAALDLLDALVRKSLLVADRSSRRTRYSMLETIRQFAEEQLAARGEASEIVLRTPATLPDREADILAVWDSPRQREAYDWF